MTHVHHTSVMYTTPQSCTPHLSNGNGRQVDNALLHLHGPEQVSYFKGNGQKRELPVLFGQKRMYPENNSGRECCWPYLIGQHPLSPVFGQKQPGTPGNSYFAQLPPVFGHFVFRWLLECSNRSTWATRTINSKLSTS